MGRVVRNILELAGDTPLVRLNRVTKGSPAEIWAKLEFCNPSGSLKDRIAVDMIEQAEKRGELGPGCTIIEATSGNTGIALSLAAAVKGYPMIVVMPEGMSEERKKIIRALGARIACTPGAETDVERAVEKVKEMVAADPKLWAAGQFTNPDNVGAHRRGTGPDLWEQTGGKVDAIVQGVGTGGTISGVGQYFKSRNPTVRIVAVEPAECAALSGGECGRHRIEGIGDGFVPPILDRSVIDEVIMVPDEEAILMARRLMCEEGVLGGISAGANVWAALQVAESLPSGAQVITFIPDSGMRYFSTDLFANV
ncbi:MAG: cysteine synthase A [Chloroflexi bacterium]|nr:cysteine synthase A [Chloroflexota bacterium]